MLATTQLSMKHRGRTFSYSDACKVTQAALIQRPAHLICVDLDEVEDVTTCALAKLIILRRALLAQRKELRLAGLRGRALAMYELSKLHRLLPLTGWGADQAIVLHSCFDEDDEVKVEGFGLANDSSSSCSLPQARAIAAV